MFIIGTFCYGHYMQSLSRDSNDLARLGYQIYGGAAALLTLLFGLLGLSLSRRVTARSAFINKLAIFTGIAGLMTLGALHFFG